MSNFSGPVTDPRTGETVTADWLDDFYGHHQYAVRFADGYTVRAEDVMAKKVVGATTGNHGDKKSEPIPGENKPNNDINIGTVPTALGTPVKFICNVCGTTGDAITVNNCAISHLMTTPTQRATTWEEEFDKKTDLEYACYGGGIIKEKGAGCWDSAIKNDTFFGEGEYPESQYELDADKIKNFIRDLLASELAIQANRVRKAMEEVTTNPSCCDAGYEYGWQEGRQAVIDTALKALSNQE